MVEQVVVEPVVGQVVEKCWKSQSSDCCIVTLCHQDVQWAVWQSLHTAGSVV